MRSGCSAHRKIYKGGPLGQPLSDHGFVVGGGRVPDALLEAEVLAGTAIRRAAAARAVAQAHSETHDGNKTLEEVSICSC